MQINPREKRLVIIGVITVIAILIWNFMPGGSSTSTAGMLATQDANNKTKDAEATLKMLNKESTGYEPRVEAMTYDMPPDELVPHVIRDLQQIAAKSGVHIRETKPVRPKVLPSGMGTSVPLEVHFLAPFQPNTMKFLYQVEDPNGKLVVDKLDITSADPRRKTVEVSVQVTAYTRNVTGSKNSEGGDTNSATPAKN